MKQNKSGLSVFVAGLKMRLNEKGLLMLKATPTASLLCCMRRVGYLLLSQRMEYILTDLESTCQVCCWNIKIRFPSLNLQIPHCPFSKKLHYIIHCARFSDYK